VALTVEAPSQAAFAKAVEQKKYHVGHHHCQGRSFETGLAGLTAAP
jgi:hypothetical protein